MNSIDQKFELIIKIRSVNNDIMNLSFLCFQVGQHSEDQERPLQVKQQRRSVRPMKIGNSHKDLRQITASRFIKTTFNKNNENKKYAQENGKATELAKRQLSSKIHQSYQANHLPISSMSQYNYFPLNNNSSSIYYYNSQIINPLPTFRPTTVTSHITHRNKQVGVPPYVQQNQQRFQNKHMNLVGLTPSMSMRPQNFMPLSSTPSKSIHSISMHLSPMPPGDMFRADMVKRINNEKSKTNVSFIYRNDDFKSQENFLPSKRNEQGIIPAIPSINTHTLFQPVVNHINLMQSMRNTFQSSPQNQLLAQNIPQPQSINNQTKDNDQQQPLMSRFIRQRQKAKSLITEQQIKRGFHNGCIQAIARVNKHKAQYQSQERVSNMQQERQFHSINIVSNLINQSYSPLKKDLKDSSTKKKKRPIFSSSASKQLSSPGINKNISSVLQYRPRPAIFQYQPERQFETPQSIKINRETEYEMKTQKKQLFGKPQTDLLDRQDESNQDERIVPGHILSAWKRVRQEE